MSQENDDNKSRRELETGGNDGGNHELPDVLSIQMTVSNKGALVWSAWRTQANDTIWPSAAITIIAREFCASQCSVSGR